MIDGMVGSDTAIQRIFSKTFDHPVIGHLVEWAPTNWVWSLSNPHVDEKTDLGTWEIGAGLVTLDELYQNMFLQGMRDPLILGVGRVSRRVRLEAGNHRINIFKKKEFPYIPVVCYVGDTAITHPGNGSHQGDIMNLKIQESVNIMGPYPIKEYSKPSKTIDLDFFKEKSFLLKT